MKLKLITYGCGTKFYPECFNPIKNADWIKPFGGLWSSPINSKFGWSDWCKIESYGDLSTYFKFVFDGRVFKIDSQEDAESAPTRLNRYLDFEKLLSLGYDAVWLTPKGQSDTRFSKNPELYGWDCESVLILNPKSIVEIIQ